MQAIGELLTSHGTVAPSSKTMVAYQYQEWTAALQASGRVLRENATTFNPFRDQLLQIHDPYLVPNYHLMDLDSMLYLEQDQIDLYQWHH